MMREYWIPVVIILTLTNHVSFLLMVWDKYAARHNFSRIPEKVLWLSALLFAALGSLLGMWTNRHKTKHVLFVLGMPALLVVQLALLFWLLRF